MIAGEFRSRMLKSVPGLAVRPTPDRLREALFNVLAPRIEGTVFLDAYAGSGAVAIEALSRGAARAILLERNPLAITVIRENLKALGLAARATVVRGSAAAAVSEFPADLAFLDPPYGLPDEYVRILTALAGSSCRLAVAQHASRLALEDRYESLHKTRVLRQGDNSLSFFEKETEPEA
ncbi:MAG TPA: 16S rRNA (guanine(966)-N(2))-methyltransferase RsmD [Bryobacteraceae bacterium]